MQYGIIEHKQVLPIQVVGAYVQPSVDDTYFLGSTTKHWKGIYIGTGGVNIGLGADANLDLIVVKVATGSPKISWRTADGTFVFSHPIEATHVTILEANNMLNFTESDQTDPAGRWRYYFDADIMYLQHGLTAAWATNQTIVKTEWNAGSPTITHSDDVLVRVGSDGDGVFLNRSAVLNANTSLTGVLIGTPVAQALAANSFMLSNITASGDFAFYANLGGNSLQFLFYDTSASELFLLNKTGQNLILLGTVATNGALNASPAFVQRCFYDADPTAGVTSTAWDVKYLLTPSAGGAAPAAALTIAIGATGAEVTALTLTNTNGVVSMTSEGLLQATGLKIGSSTAYGRLGQLIEVNTSNNFGGASFNTWEDSTKGAILDFNKARHNTIGTYTVVATGDQLGQINWRGADGTNFQDAVYLLAKVTGTVGNDRVPGLLEFHLLSDAASSVDTTVLSLTAADISCAVPLKLHITDTDGAVEGQIWYDASEDKLKFKTAAGVETITSA